MNRLIAWVLLAGICSCFLIPLSTVAKTDFNQIVVFGDSMSDNGIDDGAGFRRYSNGMIWAEHLGVMMNGADVTVLAWGGAMSSEGNYSPAAKDWSGLLWQVAQYEPSGDMDETLFIVQIGTNDLHDPDMKIAPAQVAANIGEAVKVLAEKGAEHIMVWNLFTSPTSPGYIDEKYEWYDYYKEKPEQALALYKELNSILPESFDAMKAASPGVTYYYFEADKAMDAIVPKFENTTDVWIGSKLYPEAGGWIWFDHWHFMTETHKHIAEAVMDTLEE